MEQPKNYRGEENFVFASYAHEDKDIVWSIIGRMQRDGYRIWFDDRIGPGTEWDENIAQHVEKCVCFYAFISKNYLASENCIDELTHARDMKEEERPLIVLIYLEEVELPGGMKMRYSRSQAVYKCRLSDEDFYKKMYMAEEMDGCREDSVSAKGTPQGWDEALREGCFR